MNGKTAIRTLTTACIRTQREIDSTSLSNLYRLRISLDIYFCLWYASCRNSTVPAPKTFSTPAEMRASIPPDISMGSASSGSLMKSTNRTWSLVESNTICGHIRWDRWKFYPKISSVIKNPKLLRAFNDEESYCFINWTQKRLCIFIIRGESPHEITLSRLFERICMNHQVELGRGDRELVKVAGNHFLLWIFDARVVYHKGNSIRLIMRVFKRLALLL